MTRKITSALLALLLCISLAVSVSAEGTEFIVDDIGYLADMELDLLNKQARTIHDETGVGIFFVYTTAADLEHYDVTRLVGGMEDYFIMIENSAYWCIFLGGSARDHIDGDAAEQLRSIYDQAGTYIEGISEFLDAAADLLPHGTGTTVESVPKSNEFFLYDEADLLNVEQESFLTMKLADISATYNAQVVVYTVPSVKGGDVERYLNTLYDTLDFGYGEDHDGVLLLVCMDPRQFWILSNGYAGVAIGPGDIETINDAIQPDMSDGNYTGAFSEFADQCVYYLDGYLNGFPFAFGKNLLICLAIGIVTGLIVVLCLKAQLKTVRKQDRANAYVKQNSMNITAMNDVYLYRTVSRSKKSSSSGSSGSGGGSRSTGGRSF